MGGESTGGLVRSHGGGDELRDLLVDYLGAWEARGQMKPPGQTLMEFLEAMKARGFCDREFDELTRYVYQVRYAGLPQDPAKEAAFRSLIGSFGRSESASI